MADHGIVGNRQRRQEESPSSRLSSIVYKHRAEQKFSPNDGLFLRGSLGRDSSNSDLSPSQKVNNELFNRARQTYVEPLVAGANDASGLESDDEIARDFSRMLSSAIDRSVDVYSKNLTDFRRSRSATFLDNSQALDSSCPVKRSSFRSMASLLTPGSKTQAQAKNMYREKASEFSAMKYATRKEATQWHHDPLGKALEAMQKFVVNPTARFVNSLFTPDIKGNIRRRGHPVSRGDNVGNDDPHTREHSGDLLGWHPDSPSHSNDAEGNLVAPDENDVLSFPLEGVYKPRKGST
eukprot:gnl/TRDRNA2_/TRDRNA2_154705_c0_seq2.p1 gnl/TRDRNA2_/TRDRNA2_154705_c0~~gnl/TRDRNA2_/TRDRNA2_154705_c0_seq2.p1  ORF type:complete len:294 (+),score=34.41 gnl/TRDRNA2_/TRDRNA2_154705_c0_seq2:122-1003(+)